MDVELYGQVGERARKQIEDAMHAMPAERRAAVEKAAAAAVPVMHRLEYLRVVCGLASARRAMSVFCWQCSGWNKDNLTNCTSTACPFYGSRPLEAPTPTHLDRRLNKTRTQRAGTVLGVRKLRTARVGPPRGLL